MRRACKREVTQTRLAEHVIELIPMRRLALGSLLSLALAAPSGSALGLAANSTTAAEGESKLDKRNTAVWSAEQVQELRGSGRVDDDLIDTLSTEASARAVVLFSAQGVEERSGIAVSTNLVAQGRIRAVGEKILAQLGPSDFELTGRFDLVGALAGRITRPGLLRLLRDPNVRSVELDPPVVPQLMESIPLVGLEVLQEAGLTGEGVLVAVIDSGIDTDHPDLSDDLVAEECFCSSFGGCCPNGSSRQSGPGSAEDVDGHGTAVAGVITSRGVLAPPGGAPDVGILAVRVTAGPIEYDVAASDALLAANWIRLNRSDVRLINMSLGTPEHYQSPCDYHDGFTTIASVLVDALLEQGVVGFASSMNEGSGTMMPLPACLSGVIAVGAVYDADVGTFAAYNPETGFTCTDLTTQAGQVTCFSNSDPTTDLFAPGALITTSALGGVCLGCWGTSFSAPVAVSCAALLIQAHPGIRPETIRLTLRSSPTWVTDPKNGLTFPRLDCPSALAALPACDDGQDNDADGLIDYPDDPGCLLAQAPIEDPACQDGLDNDGDGLIDFDGGQTIHGICAGGICPAGVSDPDGDGVADPDPACVGRPWRDNEATRRCGLGMELALLLSLGCFVRRRTRR